MNKIKWTFHQATFRILLLRHFINNSRNNHNKEITILKILLVEIITRTMLIIQLLKKINSWNNLQRKLKIRWIKILTKSMHLKLHRVIQINQHTSIVVLLPQQSKIDFKISNKWVIWLLIINKILTILS